MLAKRYLDRDKIETLCFGHYLRTGRRLDVEEVYDFCQRDYERELKFNPYHDEIGRFTSPPGVTVSYGRSGGSVAPKTVSSAENRAAPKATATNAPKSPLPGASGTPEQVQGSSSGSLNGLRSAFVRDAVAPIPNNADTYFELNKRQAYLNRLRHEAGSNPHPTVKADLDDLQRRLDANRQLLDARSKIADREIVEILRAGLAPVDVSAGLRNIVVGEGELRDYLAVGGAIPIAGAVGKVGKLAGSTGKVSEVATEAIQMGGPHWRVRKLPGYHSHHMPADSVSPISRGRGPAIAMLAKDHEATLSFGRFPSVIAHQKRQSELISKGDFGGAVQLDIDDIRSKFGSKYDDAIEQMLIYIQEKGF